MRESRIEQMKSIRVPLSYQTQQGALAHQFADFCIAEVSEVYLLFLLLRRANDGVVTSRAR
jgi:hypothetical protein